MSTSLCSISAECPSLQFSGRFADLEALSRGDFVSVRPTLDASTRERRLSMPPPDRRVALVLGANGFVGAHLTARLSSEPSIQTVIAATREASGRSPRQRLEDTVRQYQIANVDWRKVDVQPLNPTRPMLGLSEDEYRAICGKVDLVFNCASSSDYTVPYLGLRDDWFLSLLRVLQFCLEGRSKHLTYLGSLGARFYDSSEDFRLPDSWWYSGYNQMKRVNGELISWIARDNLLPVTLCEAPYILGSTERGLDPGLHYSWWRVIEIAKAIGLLWHGPGMVYVPVDVMVDTLVANAVAEERLPRVHPRNTEHYDNAMLAELIGARLTTWDEFLDTATRMLAPRRIQTVLSANLPLLVSILNRRDPIFVPGHSPAPYDNRTLFAKYLANVPFRDLAARDRVA